MKAWFYLRQGAPFFRVCAAASIELWDRMSLNIGGDDITEFLYVLLERINFPYRDIDLVRSYDWNIMEDLKSRLCTLAEVIFILLFSQIT